MGRRRWTAAAAIGTPLVLVGAMVWWGVHTADQWMEPQPMGREKVAQRFGVSLQAEAVLLGAFSVRIPGPGSGNLAVAKFRLPRAELKPWLKREGLSPTDKPKDLEAVLYWLEVGGFYHVSWWDPHQPKEFLVFERETPAPSAGEDWVDRLGLLVDLDDPEVGVVYMQIMLEV